MKEKCMLKFENGESIELDESFFYTPPVINEVTPFNLGSSIEINFAYKGLKYKIKTRIVESEIIV